MEEETDSFQLGYEPMRDEVLLILPHISERTASGIIKSDAVKAEEADKRRALYLQVIAVGPTVKEVKVGMEVKIRGFYPVNIDGIEYAQAYEHQVCGKKIS